MPSIRPIHYRRFEKFVVYVGCHFDRQKGDHKMYLRSGLLRPVVIRTLKDLPVREIRRNLKTLGISDEEYISMIEKF